MSWREDVGWGRVRDRQEQDGTAHVLVARTRPAGLPGLSSPPRAPRAHRAGSPCHRLPRCRWAPSAPPWPTPAECYLADAAPVTSYSISTSGREATAGPEDVAQIVAKVADSLMAVGALPVTSTMLRESPATADRAGSLPW